jgi:hypothetical protein
MVEDRTRYRNILTRGLSVIALFAVCGFGIVGTSAVLLGTSSTAQAHGGGGHGGGGGGGHSGGGGGGVHGGGGFHGGGFHRGGFRGGGVGIGFWGPGYDYPYGYSGYYGEEGTCYLVRRRVMTRYGWRIRRVQICG